ncbi:relaxase domain-containing protein [Actinacidiphila glaucinigra]|uniref:MobF family relaxase n=1 Tax=Actinacidiphila glaucinigra TaxID=235986 RepID=UPI002DD8DD4D|nr:MobF family relaxase [Actinacidiphila glaucinigra]WSD65054.1 relaxase domain-containing protein [Actinacidiphila glaucinigra]
MTCKAVTAAGYAYYRRNIAQGDGARGGGVAVSSAMPGVPVGQWHGRGAAVLGLAGEVSEPQMRALFGLGMHPDAEAIVARETWAGATKKQAWDAAKLGPAIPSLAEGSPLDRQIEQVLQQASEQLCRPLTAAEARNLKMRVAARAFRAAYRRAPGDGKELARFLASHTGKQRQARTGYDLTFSCQELSLLFALGDERVRQVVLEVQGQARTETIAWIEDHALAVRTGAGGSAQLRARPGVVAAVYLHYESRAGDPMLHEHAVISPRVQGPDGKWQNLDARLLYREIVCASELFNQRALELLCGRLGLRTEPVEVTAGQRPVMQVMGIDPRLRQLFSQRGSAIRDLAGDLLEDYQRRYGRQPGPAVRYGLLEQARVSTREAKPAARSLDALLAGWRRRAIAATDQATVDGVLRAAQAAARQASGSQATGRETTSAGVRQEAAAGMIAGPGAAAGRTAGEAASGTGLGPGGGRVAEVDVAGAAAEVLAEVSARRAVFRHRHVLAEARRYLARTLAGATAPPDAADAIADRALADADCEEVSPPDLHPAHPELTRADGESVYRSIGSRAYTTRSLLAAEERLLAATKTRAAAPVGREVFAGVAARHGGRLDAGQRELAASFAVSDTLLLAGLGPAGSGKTTAMRLLAAAVDAAGGRLIPLAPSARAAGVLGTDLDRPAHTLHSWLRGRELAAQGRPVREAFDLRPGDVVLVDEAGMAGTRLLDKVVADAAAAGALVRLLGDPRQLAAVESGGALRMITAGGGVLELDRLHRFRTDGEAGASLVLRDSDHLGEAFAWYRDRGRITAGTPHRMQQAAFAAWAKDTAAGRSTVMTAPDTATVSALNARAQAWHLDRGTVTAGRSARLRGGLRAHVGDVVVTRRNDRRRTVRGGLDFVKNGDTWTVQAIEPDGSLLVRHTGHHGRTRLTAAYVAAHCELGYASTIHRAQGMTVDTSHALATPASTREGVYVQLTRGRHTNRLYLALDYDGQDVAQVLETIAARRRRQVSATEATAELQRQAIDPATLAAQYADAAAAAITDRLTGLLERALGPGQAATVLAADTFPTVARALLKAEHAGADLPGLLARATTPAGEATVGPDPAPGPGFMPNPHSTYGTESVHGPSLTDGQDPAAALIRRLQRLTRVDQGAASGRRVLAALPSHRLHTLMARAASLGAAAHSELQAADAAASALPVPVTRTGRTHPAWPHRPYGPLTRTELDTHLATVRTACRDAERTGTPMSPAAANTVAALTAEDALRRALPWRDAAREDWQRDRTPRLSQSFLAAIRRHHSARVFDTDQRLRHARTVLAGADALTDAVNAELRRRSGTPGRRAQRPPHPSGIPDWVADRTAQDHPATPAHWRHHLAVRHRILDWALAQRGRTLAASPPAWARPLGPPLPADSPERRTAWELTCALTELWRTRQAITTAPGLGPRPDNPVDAAAWDAMTARIRDLTPGRRPTRAQGPGELAPALLPTPPGRPSRPPATPAPIPLPPPPIPPMKLPAPPKVEGPTVPPPPPTPPLTPPPGPAPIPPAQPTLVPPVPGRRPAPTLSDVAHLTQAAALGRRALTAALTGGPAPEAWIAGITLPGQDSAADEHTYTRLVIAIADYRRRHDDAGLDILGRRPTDDSAREWEELTNALNRYTHTRVQARLNALRRRKAGSLPLQPAPAPRPPGPPPWAQGPDTRPAPGPRS